MESTREYLSSFFYTPVKKTPTRNNRFESYEEFLELQRQLSLLQNKEETLQPYADAAKKTGVKTLGSVKHEIISKLRTALKIDIDTFNQTSCNTYSPATRTKSELEEMKSFITQLREPIRKTVLAQHETLAGNRDNNKSYASCALKFGLYGLALATAAVSVITLPAIAAGAYYANKKTQEATGLNNNEADTIIILRDLIMELDKILKDLNDKLKPREECNIISRKP